MKAALQKSPISLDHTFEVKLLKAPYFDPKWHFHKEYQLFVVLNGTGTRFVGDHVAPFKKGHLVFTGPNLPHLWRSDPEYFDSEQQNYTEGIVIYFHELFLGKDFLRKEEMYKLKQLFVKAHRGMEITGTTASEVIKLMRLLLLQKDFESILTFLQILNLLTNTSSFNLLASAGYNNSLKESETERMSKVHEYVMKNFREKISLDEVATIASMTPSSFSRYFKTHTNKTFSDFLTEIRIGYACKLLIEMKMSISEACYESGFNTLSNFNRQFKAVTKHSPLGYRKKFITSLLVISN